MDDLTCSGQVVNQTLSEIDYINKKLGGNQVTLNGLKILIKGKDLKKPIKIVDLGCGGGGMLRYLSDWSKTENLRIKFIGIDANPNIIDFAKKQSENYPDIEFSAMDILSEKYNQEFFDVILCTLVLHHFKKDELVSLLKNFKNQTSIGVVINDLHRHWLAYYSIKLLTSILSKSSMVKFDAPLSVKRGFLKKEIQDILRMADAESLSMIKWKWAFRWQIIIAN